MKTREDIEAYLIRSGLPYQEIDGETWLVRVEDDVQPVVVRLQGSLVLVRAEVGDVPANGREAFYAALLRENAESLVHCSYGLAGEKVILSGALLLETIDYGEFLSTLDDMALALSRGTDVAAR